MSSQDKLPPPWELRWSTTKSRFYFYNSKTKSSQWQSPLKGHTTKNVTQSVEQPDTTNPKKTSSVAVPLPTAKSSIKPDKTKSVETDVEQQKKTKRKLDDDLEMFSEKGDYYPEKKKSFHPRVLQITEPMRSGEKLFDKGSRPSTVATRSTADDKTVLQNEKPSKKAKKKKKKGNRLDTVDEKLENDSKSVESIGPPLQRKTDEIKQEEEEEDMEVEYSPEVQIIFQEIQGIRDEMKKMETEEVTSEVQMIVDNMASMPSPQGLSQKLWLVLDTNLFLEDRVLLRDLKDQMSRQFGDDFVFVIPWIVLQEIDRIKDNKRPVLRDSGLNLSNRARAAVNMIHNWLETKDPNIIGQNPRDAASKFESKGGLPIESNDDKILHCCLQFQDQYSGGQVALLTLDKNLRNKGMVLGINTYSRETLQKWLNNLTPSRSSTSTDDKPPPPHSRGAPVHSNASKFTPRSDSTAAKTFNHAPVSTPQNSASSASLRFSSANSLPSTLSPTPRKVFTPSKSLKPGVNESVPGAGCSSSSPFHSVPFPQESDFVGNGVSQSVITFLDEQMVSIEKVMLRGLSALLERTMRDAYKDLWEDILNLKKPWSLVAVMKAIRKHWIAIFRSFWKHDGQCEVEKLCSTLQTTPETFSELQYVLEKCSGLWDLFSPTRWDVESSHKALSLIKEQSLSEIKKLEEALKRRKEPEASENSVVEGGPALFQCSTPMESSAIVTSASMSDVTPPSATPCSLSLPAGLVEAVVTDDELQRVYECFDAVLKHVISLRDLIREELASSSSLNRPAVLQSYVQLGQYVCAIHDQYERALADKKNANESNVYFDLLSTLSAFTQQFNVQVSPITCQGLCQFFKDEAKRAVVEIGLSQMAAIRSSVIDCQQLLTPAESWHLFSN